MMYMVSYDLSDKTPHDIDFIQAELRNVQDWWHFLTNTWLIVTDESADQLAARLRTKLDKHDRLLVFAVSGDYSGYLPKEAWDWIQHAVASGALPNIPAPRSPFRPPKRFDPPHG